MPSALGLVIDYESLTMIFTGNMWSILPWRLGDGKNQVHKGRELSMFLMLVGLNMTGHMIATSLVMASDGQPLVPHNMTAAIVKDVPFLEPLLPESLAAQEFLLFCMLPAVFCFLVSCLLLACYYRCTHTWREVGSDRDINCRRCCCCCYCCCCPSLGRLCWQENPISGEIPFWEQARV